MKPDLVFAFENAGWPALLIDCAGAVCRANPMAIKLFGAALEGASAQLSTIWSPENSGTVDQSLARWEKSPAAAVSLKFQGRDGHALSFLASVCACAQDGQNYLLLQLFPDIAMKAGGQGGENSPVQKQKLEYALQLARTVALEFNDALTSILGHTSLVLSKMEPNHAWRSSLLEVEKSATKAAEVVGDLATFSHQEEKRAQAAGHLNLLLERTVQQLRLSIGLEGVEWVLQLERKPFAVKCDEAKMQQAFLKILENALEALPGKGRITVQTRNVQLAERKQDGNVQLAAGTYVCVEISDNGCGIASEVLPRIFEPFFTTRRGHHRGLGLAWVYGTVTSHGGAVAVSSRPGAGTSMRVYLPAEKGAVKNQPLPPASDLNGTQTILLVDDEEMLLTMGQTVLSSYGYQVLTANSGQKALDILSGSRTAVDLLITDLVMPAMSGRELVKHVRQLSPATRVLCTSGYIWPVDEENAAAFLQKPFTSQELLRKVKQALVDPVPA